MQPIRTQALNPFELARQVISEFLNNGMSKMYELNYSEIDSDTVKPIYGDVSLLNRMLHNLIQNSITHNPKRLSDICLCQNRQRNLYILRHGLRLWNKRILSGTAK